MSASKSVQPFNLKKHNARLHELYYLPQPIPKILNHFQGNCFARTEEEHESCINNPMRDNEDEQYETHNSRVVQGGIVFAQVKCKMC